jgi:hypothetical protein
MRARGLRASVFPGDQGNFLSLQLFAGTTTALSMELQDLL